MHYRPNTDAVMTGLGETPFFSFIIFSFLFFNYEGETIYYVPEGRDGRGNGRDTVESCGGFVMGDGTLAWSGLGDSDI